MHKVGTYQVFKIYLSCFDDKRYIYIYIYILDDGINSLAYFHEGIFKNKSD